MNSPDYYVLDGEVYCQDCAIAQIRRDCKNLFGRNSCTYWKALAHLKKNHGPYSAEEADSPQHCGGGDDCKHRENWGTKADPYWVGQFFENPLTADGVQYVRSMHREDPTDVTERWMKHYDLVNLDLYYVHIIDGITKLRGPFDSPEDRSTSIKNDVTSVFVPNRIFVLLKINQGKLELEP